MENRYRILVAEDDTFIRNIIRNTLERDYEVTTQRNGIEAMSWLEMGNPTDLVITDLRMPHMDGTELIQNIRASSLFRHLPIIVMSSLEGSDNRITHLELGADDFITKPFNPREVKARVSAVLRRAQRTAL